MALKDRFRRAVTRSNTAPHEKRGSISSSSSSKPVSGTVTPTNGDNDNLAPLTSIQTAVDTKSPAISLTKTHSLLGKTMTWGGGSSSGKSKEEIQKEKKLKQWKKKDEVEWTSPTSQRPGRKDMGCQNTLRAFDFRKAAFGDGERSKSICSGVSPSASRNNSVDEGVTLSSVAGKRGSAGAVGPGKLSQELTRDNATNGVEKKHLDGVQE